MESELQKRWDAAVKSKDLTPHERRVIAEEMERGITIPKNWSQLCLASIRKEGAETKNRYGIKIGQTDVYCTKCGRPCTPGQHTCKDQRLRMLHEAEKVKHTPTSEHCERIQLIGVRKAARKLKVDRHTVSMWIRGGSVPAKYHEAVACF